MLEVENLDLHYGQSRILYEVSFQAPKGQITTLIGNNGVGKTSTLKAIAGRHPASAGTISVDGTPVRLTTAFQAANAGIAYVPQGREVFPMMTVEENLETGFACLPKADHHIPDHIYDLFPVLREMKARRGGDLSGGQQQQLAIEPTEGIQPNVIQQIGDALRLLRTQGEMAIVLVEQNADFAYALGDSFIVVEGGRNGPRKLKADYTKDMLIADLAL